MRFYNLASVIICALLFVCTNALSENNDPDFSTNDSSVVDTVDFKLLITKYPIDSTSIRNFEFQILNYERIDSIRKPVTSDIVFAGSSTMAIWNNRLNKDMIALPVIDRGFGGSNIMQNIFYFNRIMKPYAPKICVFYCENDIESGANRVFELIRYYEYLFHLNYPESMLYFVSFKPSVVRQALIPEMKIVNKMIEKYSSKRPNTGFINIFEAMMPNDQLDKSLLCQDSLHLSSKGYDLWTSIIKPVIAKKYAEITKDNAIKNISKDYVLCTKLGTVHLGDSNQYVSYKLFTPQGMIIDQKNIHNVHTLQLKHVSTGFYILELINERNEFFLKKIYLKN